MKLTPSQGRSPAVRNLPSPATHFVHAVSYLEFRTGLTYLEVYHIIWQRKWKRRRGVLGKWCEIKRAMYAQYVEGRYERPYNAHGRIKCSECGGAVELGNWHSKTCGNTDCRRARKTRLQREARSGSTWPHLRDGQN